VSAPRRIRDWETRLFAFAQTLRAEPFRWGWSDCVVLAFRALDQMLGEAQPGAFTLAWGGRWSSRREAAAAARETTLEDELLAAGAEPRSARYASTGDVIVVTGRRLPRAYVHLGALLLSSTPRTGVCLLRPGAMLARPDLLALRVG